MKRSYNLINFNIYVAHFFFISILSGLVSCKKFVTVSPPTTEAASTAVFSNNSSATAAIFNIYSNMNSHADSYAIAAANGLLSDELLTYTNPSSNPTPNELYKDNLNAIDVYAPSPWLDGYNYIYQANAIIAGLQTTTGVSAAVKQQLTGEALFVRGYWLFYLTNFYGDVPLALSSDYTVTSMLGRTPRLQVLQQCISDLSQAYTSLNANYVDATDSVVTTERVRPNKSVAAALLARVYLYLGDYSNKNANDYAQAVQWAGKVIGNSVYSLSPLTGSNSVFTKNSSEAIWQLQTSSALNSGATYDGQYFILTAAPSTNSLANSNAITTFLLNAFEPGDNRKSSWIGSYSSGGNTWYFPYKYKYNANNAGGNVYEYTMVLRLGEQYLIRAEAEAEQGQVAPAITDLNVIRTRAGLANYSGATDQASVLSAILHERQVELFCEWGNRWFDLIRTGNINQVMGNITPQKGGIWSSDGHQALYPIPLSEIQKDPNLTQNAGY